MRIRQPSLAIARMLGALGSILMPVAGLVNQAPANREIAAEQNGTQQRLATEARAVFRLFHDLFPEVAERESRTAHVEPAGPEDTLLPGSYLFLELYCTDPECDCERALLSVVEKKRGIVATISYGFGPGRFTKDDDPRDLFLDPLNPQSAIAEEMLSLFKEIVLDEEYDQRLRRHYRMVKSLSRVEGRPPGTVSGPIWERSTDRREKSARQRRKEQKAARRTNRR
jgi:hypothetical protein